MLKLSKSNKVEGLMGSDDSVAGRLEDIAHRFLGSGTKNGYIKLFLILIYSINTATILLFS